MASWVAAGDNLSADPEKAGEQFKLSLTYMDVRFLVDDLNLAQGPGAQGRAPTWQAGRAAGAGKEGPAREGQGKARPGQGDAEEPPEEPGRGAEDLRRAAPGRSPFGRQGHPDSGAIASGTVTFSDGVTGKWIVDNYGRPGLTEISKPGYRPNPADAQAFMQELNLAMQKRGL